MLAEIIAIGDELLIGQTLDTNSGWIGEQLSLIGIKVQQISSITDQESAIIEALEAAKQRVKLVIITGGLGPTKDDLTKQTLCEYFKTSLVLDQAVLSHIEKLYKKYRVPVSKMNRDQALLPETAKILPNSIGTASGMWFEQEAVVFISLPGVPAEMKQILTETGFTKLQTFFKPDPIIYKTIRTIGLAESKLATLLTEWENSLELLNLKLAYLPASGMVRLRITGHNLKMIEQKTAELTKLLGPVIYGYDKETLEEIIGNLLIKQGKTVATAESCTGGSISRLLTRLSGSSAYFKGAIVSYDNDVKINVLKVNAQDIATQGAVSQTVVEQMATNARQILQTDFAIATSGIAGPTGGTTEKPVGTVWIAVASEDRVESVKLDLAYKNRERTVLVSSQYALDLLRTTFL